jgi:hypothetical protein
MTNRDPTSRWPPPRVTTLIVAAPHGCDTLAGPRRASKRAAIALAAHLRYRIRRGAVVAPT